MLNRDPERGDIIVYEKNQTFPKRGLKKVTTVVEEVKTDTVYCGIDGNISRDSIVSIKGKSPDYDPETNEFETTVVK